MDEPIEKTDCRESTSTDNVRTRVSSWISELVIEVRRKTPRNHLQKWTESTRRSADIVTDVERILNNVPESTSDISENDKIIEEDPRPVVCDDEKATSSTNFWSAGSFFNKVKGFEKFGSEQEENRTTVTNLKTFGKTKINEFYDKVRINKDRYNMLKNRQKMERPSMNTSERDIDEKHDDIDDELLSSTACSLNKSKDETSLSDNLLDISENSENLFSFNHKIPLGMIGRSSTSSSYITPVEQQPEQQQQPHSLISVSAIHKNHLANIGRSFSEQNDDDDDEDDNSFVLNERSRSYSHVVGERPNSNNSTNNVSSSLPTFFGHKSVPVSPIPQYKGAISREASFSESSRRRSLFRDSSVQSDSSHCSSVESLLESRKPDPEAILINLGFGPVQSEDVLSKIPKRFLKPSQVKGIDTESFLRQQQMANHLHDHSVLGYRGLVGNPDIPPSLIVAKIMERFELNERNRCIMDIHMNRPQSAPPTPGPNQ